MIAAAACLGAAAAPLALVSLDGEPVQLRPDSGAPALLVHFWATWCPSCIEELGVLDAAARSCTRARIRIVAVNVGESPEVVRDYLADHDLGLEVLRDPEGAVWRRLSGAGLPANATWSGGSRSVEVGPRSAAQWRERLSDLGCER